MNKRWQIFLVCVGLFAAGAVCGGVVALRYARAGDRSRPLERGRIADQLMERFTSELKLTPEQQAQIRPILLQGDDEIRRLRRESFRAGATVMERMHNEIGAVLTPEQREKLEAMRERFHHRVENRRRGEPGDPGRPGGPGAPPPEPRGEP